MNGFANDVTVINIEVHILSTSRYGQKLSGRLRSLALFGHLTKTPLY